MVKSDGKVGRGRGLRGKRRFPGYEQDHHRNTHVLVAFYFLSAVIFNAKHQILSTSRGWNAWYPMQWRTQERMGQGLSQSPHRGKVTEKGAPGTVRGESSRRDTSCSLRPPPSRQATKDLTC